ncbi:type VI secretion system protein ImpF [Andreprevotia lacus DSM 23236]|jgi:type VI secretion system protein ImpF|uniref:Type VI secretion system protein ImpF n=1 Tax=Andreprevotia lacus DSM 23236 TaxID=1121001 RepID=A0A1W1XM41_9NEIS|nr:type VI secretion system baseplate subunit TssE [Andreprevotia lacus]SMC25013.1 type VI secretion system protein ImpF [Andreprevotia lacus DSM 23236]
MKREDFFFPSLFDRLTGTQAVVAGRNGARLPDRKGLLASIQRDLSFLLNSITAYHIAPDSDEPYSTSVIGFGFPCLNGQTSSQGTAKQIERWIRQAIVRFEPRIDPVSLKVIPLLNGAESHHQLLAFQIAGYVLANPVPIELLLRTQLDVENGRFSVSEY